MTEQKDWHMEVTDIINGKTREEGSLPRRRETMANGRTTSEAGNIDYECHLHHKAPRMERAPITTNMGPKCGKNRMKWIGFEGKELDVGTKSQHC